MNDPALLAVKLRTMIRLLIRRAYSVSVADHGPSRSEQGVMAWLDEKGDLTPSGLAALEKVRPQTMGQTLDSLARRHWIRRSPHPADRRRILISLSPSGRKALLKKRELRQAWLVEQLERLNAGDYRTLAAALEVLDRIAQS